VLGEQLPGRVRRAGLGLEALVVAIGLVVLAGWLFDVETLKSISPTLSSMKPNTAIAFVLSGTAVWLLRPVPHGRRHLLGIAVAAMVLAIALATLSEYVLGWSLHIDQLLFHDSAPQVGAAPPGRPGANTATAFLLIGLALLCLDLSRPARVKVHELAAGLAGVIAFSALVGYLYDVESLEAGFGFLERNVTPMAIHTALTFLVLVVAVVASRPEVGLTRLVRSGGAGGALARRLLVVVAVVPTLVGFTVLEFERAGWMEANLGYAFLVSALSVVLLVLVGVTAGSLDRADADRRRAYEALRDVNVGLEERVSERTAELAHEVQVRQHAEAQLRGLLESAPDATVVVGADGLIKLVNAQAELVFGYRREDLIGREVAMLVPPRLRSVHRAHVGGLFERPHARAMGEQRELYGVRQDGSEFPVEISLGVLETADEVLVSAAIRDVTERKAAERARRELAGIVESTEDAIISVAVEDDRAGTIASWNRGAERLFGYTAEEAIGRNVSMLDPPSGSGEIARLLQRIEGGERIELFETVRTAKDGRQIEVAISASPLQDASGTTVGIAAIVRDITDRNRAEREQQEFRAKLAETQKLEALGVLAGGLAHDFNNLLTVILGNTSVALSELAGDSNVREPLQHVAAAAERSAELARQMLAYSGKGRFVVEPVLLSEVVDEMARLIESTISKKARLRLSFSPDTPVIEADLTQVRQVVLNLITNASDALGDETGTITVTTGSVDADSGYLSGFELSDDLPVGEYAFLEVSDDGVGMDEATRAMIFDPFFTTKFTGRGLGLAAVQGIIRGHGGAINVESRPGEGTAFRLLFPASDRAQMLGAEDVAPRAWLGRGTVLVADDEEGVRRLAALLLERLGFTVVEAADGIETLRAIRDCAGELAFVLLDLTMPGLNGDEILQELAIAGLDVPVILSSGYNSHDVVERFADRGVAAFLQKPYDLDALRDVVRGVLARVA